MSETPKATVTLPTRADLAEFAAAIAVGDKVRFTPRVGDGPRWWVVRARTDRFLAATRQAAFRPAGTLFYTIVDTVGWDHIYNGAGNGLVRSSLNTLGGGWDLGPAGEGCEQALAALESGHYALSRRRVTNVWNIERQTRKAPR